MSRDGVSLKFGSGISDIITPERPPAQLLDNVAAFIRRFVHLPAAQAAIVTLWVVHTHALTLAVTTPYLAITSAEKRSGKTRLLEVLELLVPGRAAGTGGNGLCAGQLHRTAAGRDRGIGMAGLP